MALIKKHNNAVTEVSEAPTQDLEGLIAQLHQGDNSERRQAAKSLVDFPESADALITALYDEPQTEVREAILSTLIRIGDTNSIPALVEFLGSQKIGLRNEVFEVLKARPEVSVAIIDELLLEKDPDIRIYAVNLMEIIRDPGLEARLIDVLESDSHVNVCATALNLLCEVATKASLNVLEDVKSRFANEPYICFTADLTIGRIHGN